MDTWLIWALVLFVAGLVITMVEVVLPSGGLLGLVALACLVGSLACAYQLSGWAAVILACVEGVCVPLVIVLAFKVLPKTSLGKQLILSPPAKADKDDSKGDHQQSKRDDAFEALLGKEGVVVAALRPSGTADFSGRRVSVVSNGESIAHGTHVRVVHVEGNRVVVESVVE
ncbi:MAG: hypothetical protein JXQ75_20735 [Phycisphaerae bacterium]|nr:hypothetical protein [Phycisphaerae bacterium]